MIEIRKIKLNNKSRKGDYIVLKEENMPTRYYKISLDENAEAIIAYYLDRYDNRRKLKGTLRDYKNAFYDSKRAELKPVLKRFIQRYQREVRTAKVHKRIKKGISQVVIEDIHNIDDMKIRKAYSNCLKPLVKDRGLLNLLTLESNIQKLATRFEYRAMFLDSENKEIQEVVLAGKKSLREVIRDIKAYFKKGMSFHEMSNGNKDLGALGYTTYMKTSRADLNKVNIRMVFRRG